ncbi:MAG TPA: methyltransferase domain-containing protein [Micropepsaceae bacterium]|jgi:SAM-dependent methyltransferase
MALDVRTLEEFYAGRIGQVARRLILQRLRTLWPTLSGRRVLGLGYAAPYLRPMVGDAERTIAAIPEALGVASWGVGGRSLTTVVDELALPFPDSFFDCQLVIHGLEATEAQRPFLRELWRVLAPAGRMIVVAPNRASLWAQMETSPFGHGQPYSRGQLARLLDESLFRPEYWDAALFMPPFGGRRSLRGGRAWERIGARVWPRLAGVHIVEATKSLYAPVGLVKARRRGVLKPAMVSNAPSKNMPSRR